MGDGTSRGRRRYGIVGIVAAVAALWTASLGVTAAPANAAAPARAGTVSARADAVIHVATTGHDTARCGRVARPCKTISYAYRRAANGGTIQVAAGTYTLAGSLKIARPGARRRGATAGVTATTHAPGRPGRTPVTIAGLKHDPTDEHDSTGKPGSTGKPDYIDQLLDEPSFAPIKALLMKIRGHVSLAMTVPPAGLNAHDHGSSRQSRPQTMSLPVARTAGSTAAYAARSVTFIITITSLESAASGQGGAALVHLSRPRPVVQGLPRARPGTGQYRVRQAPQHPAHRRVATTGRGCAARTAMCSGSRTIARAPIVPVTG